MIYRPSQRRLENYNNGQAKDASYSSKKDLSFNVSSCNLEQLRLQFIKEGGEITTFTQEDVEAYKLPNISRNGGRSHTDKVNRVKGEIKDGL